MGQRHQAFIRTINPHTALRKHGIDYKKAKVNQDHVKTFGRGKYSVLAYHHQWLYGATAIGNAYQVLQFNTTNSKDNYTSHLFSENHFYYKRYNKECPLEYAKLVGYVMNIQNNPISHSVGRTGLEEAWFLNDSEPEMRENFDYGDNNDGITIIDTETGKYCFMFCHSTEEKDGTSVPIYTPLDALTYLKIYYDVRDEENKELFDLVKKTFKNFEVLSLKEVKKMFPKVYQREARNVGKYECTYK